MTIQNAQQNKPIKTALVTGASGFIGIRLVYELLKINYRVIAAVRHLDKNKTYILNEFKHTDLDLNQLRFVEYDLEYSIFDHAQLYLYKDEIEYVFHTASSFEWGLKPKRAQQLNVRSSEQLVQWCAELPQLKRLIWIGGYRIAGDYSAYSDACLYRKLGAYEASKVQRHRAMMRISNKLNLAWTAVHPASVIDGYYPFQSNQVIGFAEIVKALFYGRLMALPGNNRSYIPLCNAHYLSKFLSRVCDYETSIHQQYHLVDQNTPKLHELIKTIALHIGVPSPHFSIPTWLLYKLPSFILFSSKETLNFLSEDQYQSKNTDELAEKMGIQADYATQVYLIKWINQLIRYRFGQSKS